jgi:hypothetical protein
MGRIGVKIGDERQGGEPARAIVGKGIKIQTTLAGPVEQIDLRRDQVHGLSESRREPISPNWGIKREEGPDHPARLVFVVVEGKPQLAGINS